MEQNPSNVCLHEVVAYLSVSMAFSDRGVVTKHSPHLFAKQLGVEVITYTHVHSVRSYPI